MMCGTLRKVHILICIELITNMITGLYMYISLVIWLSKSNAYTIDVCVCTGLSKKLDKLSQRKDCKVLKTWLHSIKNHIYWSATSSVSGPEKVAKWTSLLNHIQNVHVHENPLFPKCEHPDRVSRDQKKWFQPGMTI